jgi:signal transduction histidine kinase/ligand-binding sensor domain-containing protein
MKRNPQGSPVASPRVWLLSLSVACLLIYVISSRAETVDESVPLSDISHSAWTARDGAPTDITSLAQTTDGYLWIGTPLGLHRFDGLKFSGFPSTSADPKLPGREISALAADERNGLWVGFSHGGLAYLANRTVTEVALPDRYKYAAIGGLYCCSQHFLWILAGDTILRWDGQSWENIGSIYALPPSTYFTLFFDRGGNIWTAARHHVYVLKSGASRFQDSGQGVFSVTQFAQSSNGEIWISNGWISIRPLFRNCKTAQVHLRGTAAAVLDPEGQLWFAEDSSGVGRISDLEHACEQRPTVALFTHRDGLSANVTRSILRDHHGNIWVGTEGGLDRFRPRSFLSVLDGRFMYYPALAKGQDGSIWAEAHGMPLQHITKDGIVSLGKKLGSSPIALDHDGRVWLLDPWDHKLHCEDPRSEKDLVFDVPDRFKDTAAQQIVVRSDQSVLVNLEGNGLWSFDGQWQQAHFRGLPADTPTSLNVDGATVWIGYDNNRLFQVLPDSTNAIPRSLGLDAGTVLSVSSDRNTVWVVGTEGVDYEKDNRFVPLRLRDPALTQGTSGIAYDDDRNLWLNTGAGVVRVPQREVRHALQDPKYSASATVFGDADGIFGTPSQAKPVPSLIKAGDGQLWIATTGNILRTTPSLFGKPSTPPTIEVEAVKVDGIPQPFGTSEMTLQAGRDNRLEIDYAGIDLDTPAQASYRYLLEGIDSTWQSAERSREAVYANLAPGRYRFRVSATVDGEHWGELNAPIVFTVHPAFYQRIWFMALCALVVAVLLWLLYLMRLRYVTSRIKDRLEQRANERLRIARELHDTLLQSIHGLMLRFHYATEELEEGHPARPALRTALQRADDLVVEGRNRVQDLRGEVDRNRSLTDLIKQTALELKPEDGPNVHVTEEGLRRPMQAIVKEELCRICREGVVNSLSHSKATSIEIELNYGAAFFDLRLKDNGCGIDPVVLKEGGRSGHWGLHGMKERAKNIGASLRIWSTPGRGTEIEVRLRAAAAYDSNPFPLVKLFCWRSQIFGNRG